MLTCFHGTGVALTSRRESLVLKTWEAIGLAAQPHSRRHRQSHSVDAQMRFISLMAAGKVMKYCIVCSTKGDITKLENKCKIHISDLCNVLDPPTLITSKLWFNKH